MGINWNEIDNVMGKGRGGGQKRAARNFFLRKGETKPVRVLSEEYVQGYKHWVPRTKSYELCSERPDCVYCKVAEDSQGKSCGYRKHFTTFWVYDYSKYHIQKAANPKDKPRFESCTGVASTCKWCQIGMDLRESGVKKMELWKRDTKMLRTADEALSSRCASCAVGKLTITGYECRHCGNALPHVDTDYVMVTCPSCSKQSMPSGIYACSNCEVPTPANITSADLDATKFDDGATSFQPGPATPLREDITKITLPVLKAEYNPDPASVQAQHLGVANPFGGEEYKEYAPQTGNVKEVFHDDTDTFK